MSTIQEHTQVLDQLQAEINRVLEQTGRLFAAAKGGSKSTPAAQALKLKRELPRSINRFHEALDQLEDELQLAKTVMRRDLAVCREKAGQQVPKAVNGSAPTSVLDGATKTTSTLHSDSAQQEADLRNDEAVVQDQSQAEATLSESMKHRSENRDKNPVRSPEQLRDEDKLPAASESPPEAAEAQGRTSDSDLKIDTQGQQQEAGKHDEDRAEDEKAPDTGTFSNTGDLDSLFDDPASAGPGGASTDFNIDSNTSAEIDFDAFGPNLDHNADDDNISALLPGLQDYANTGPAGSGEPDFNALFATDAPAAGASQGVGGGDQQGAGESQDPTFDFMDFDFNADGYAGGGEDGPGNNQDFEFTFD